MRLQLDTNSAIVGREWLLTSLETADAPINTPITCGLDAGFQGYSIMFSRTQV
jgi:hypothetical protein